MEYIYGRLLFLDIVLRLENSLLFTLVSSMRSLVFLEISDCMNHIETLDFYLSLAEGTHSWCSFFRYWKDFRRYFRCEYPIKCLKHPIKSLTTEFDFSHIPNRILWIEIVISLKDFSRTTPFSVIFSLIFNKLTRSGVLQMPHMLPSEAAFEQAVSALGIRNQNWVVVYDTKGIFSAARVWW